MAINFAAASTAGLNNPGTEIITLVKDGSGNFINPPSYDKMRAYLSSGEVPMLFVTAEGGETGSLYQFAEYSETENKIRFSNSANAIEFCAGCEVPNVVDVGGGGGVDDVYTIKRILNEDTGETELQGDYAGALAAYESGKSLKFVDATASGGEAFVFCESFSYAYAPSSSKFRFACYNGANFLTYTLDASGITSSGEGTHIERLYVTTYGGLFLKSAGSPGKMFRVMVSGTGELSAEEVT